MSVTKALVLGLILAINNAHYIRNKVLGCDGDVYWDFGDSIIKHEITLTNNENKNHVCRQACNNNDNCDAWGINANNNDVCNLFTIKGPGLIYNCDVNAITKYVGEIKKCLNNNHLDASVIVGFSNEGNGAMLDYDVNTRCYKDTAPGM